MKQIVILFGFLVVTPNVIAAVSDEDIQQLREQIALLSQRLDQLAAENAELRDSQDRAETAVAAESWPDRIKFDGDFRYRYESIDAEGSSTRRRNRIRARTNIKAHVAENIDVGFGLATGGDDPVSTNQTLGGGGSSKGVALNLAYVDWEAIDGLHLLAGKFKNPLTKAGGQALLWDGDWTPEGLALKYQRDRFFINAFGSFLESDNKNNNDSFAWGSQFGMTGMVGDVKLTGGVAYYSIDSAGKMTTFGDTSDPDDYFGNTAVETGGLPCGTTPGTDCVYLYDYTLTEFFAEASFEVGGWPLSIFGDYINNSDASDDDTGWTIGAKLGQAKDRGQMQFTYLYAEKEADAMLGLVTDSDFGGGGTDSKGHWLQFNYGVSKNWTIGAQYFINEVDITTGTERDYDRLMIDMQWKWK
ncbi:MAG: putative porin [Woeseiaceae bacterium]